jgi:serine/threonine-protein kinase HipA
MAMKVGSEYRIVRISGRHWRRYAEANGLDSDETVARLDSLAARVPECFRRAAQEAGVQALASGLPERLAERVAAHAARCREALARD